MHCSKPLAIARLLLCDGRSTGTVADVSCHHGVLKFSLMDASINPLLYLRNPKRGSPAAWARQLLAFFFIVAAAYVFFQSQSYSGPKQLDLHTLELKNLDGSRFDVSGLQGHAVVLNFWAPWCPPCRREMPSLEKLHQNHPEVTVLGIEADPEQYHNASLMEGRSQITYPLLQFTPSLERAVGPIHSLPTTLYISGSGRVTHAVTGIVPERLMEHYLSSVTKIR